MYFCLKQFLHAHRWLCSLLHQLYLLQPLNGYQGPQPGDERRGPKRTKKLLCITKPLHGVQIQRDIRADCVDSQRDWSLDTVFLGEKVSVPLPLERQYLNGFLSRRGLQLRTMLMTCLGQLLGGKRRERKKLHRASLRKGQRNANR